MRLSLEWILGLGCVLNVACGTDTGESGDSRRIILDSGLVADGSAVDARGSLTDGAVPLVDGGSPDGGLAIDAGPPDGGLPIDAGPCVPDCANSQCGTDGCGGTCGTCEAPAVCNAGQCSEAGCGDLFACDGECFSLLDDPAHCGNCSRSCTVPAGSGAVAYCAEAECGVACPAAPGVAVSLADDPNNCGVCGRVCASGPDGQAPCVQGVCADPCGDLLNCHGQCFGDESPYAAICGGACCPVDPLAREIGGPGAPAGELEIELLVVPEASRITARIAFEDGRCVGWPAENAPNEAVGVFLVQLDDMLFRPIVESVRARGEGCHVVEAQLPPGVYGLVVQTRTRAAVPAWRGQITTGPVVPEGMGVLRASAMAQPDANQRLTVELAEVSRLLVSPLSSGRCKAGGVSVAPFAGLVRTAATSCAVLDVVLTPGRYVVEVAAEFGDYEQALVLIEPLPIDAQVGQVGQPGAAGPVAAGAVRRFAVALEPGAYPYRVQGPACGAARALALHRPREAALVDGAGGCPSGTLYAREAGEQAIYVYGEHQAALGEVSVSVGPRVAIGQDLIDGDTVIDRRGLDPVQWTQQTYWLRVEQGQLVTLAIDDPVGGCNQGDMDTDMAVFHHGIQVASDRNSGEGECASLMTFFEMGEYRVVVDSRALTRYRLTVDFP
jgi:hypothetical protein